MQIITDDVRHYLNPVIRGILEMRIDKMPYERNLMNMNVVHFNDLAELAREYQNVKPCYAFVHQVRFRKPEAYIEITGEERVTNTRPKELILQDRYGDEWCWADDNATNPPKPKIKEIFTDHEILDFVYGLANFDANSSGPIGHIDIFGYKGRTTKRKTVTEFNQRPLLAVNLIYEINVTE